MTWRTASLKNRWLAVACVVIAVGMSGLVAGAVWASGVRGEHPFDSGSPEKTWPGHSPVRDRDGNPVGWIADGAGGTIIVPLPDRYASDPMNGSATGVKVVYNDDGRAIGIFGSSGFIKGGLVSETQLDPAVERDIIDDAIANTSHTIAPSTDP